MRNLCDTCKFAKWDLSSVSNAYCEQNLIYKVVDEGNYVTECSCYKPKNIFIKLLRLFIK